MSSSPPHSPLEVPNEVLLLVFLHGFKGGADTFAQFPERLQHIISSTEGSVHVQAILYPPYDTRGELIDAVVNHVTWLEQLVVEREKEYRAKGGNGPIRVVLLAHSMGGLVIADAALNLLASAPPKPDILGLIAYDTPYYGLNPAVFANKIDQAIGYVQQGQAVLTAAGVGVGIFNAFGFGSTPAAKEEAAPATPSSSSSKTSTSTAVAPPVDVAEPPTKKSWFNPLTAVGAVGAAAVLAGAGAAYWHKDRLSTSWSWATSHLSFVGELWKTQLQETRMVKLERAGQEQGLGFHCFYTILPKTTANPSTSRTFIVLPSMAIGDNFTPNINNRAGDEIAAHIEMFTDQSDGMYSLGSDTCKLVTRWLAQARVRESTGEKGKTTGVGPKLV